MQGDDAGGTQDRLSKPAHAEQQQKHPDPKLQLLDWDGGQRRAKDQDQKRQQQKGKTGADERAAPTTHGTDREHDGQRLHAFDERGEEGAQDRRGGVSPQRDHGTSRRIRDCNDGLFIFLPPS